MSSFKDLKEATKFFAVKLKEFGDDKNTDYKKMSELTNGFGKIIKSFQVQIEAARRKKKVDLSF